VTSLAVPLFPATTIAKLKIKASYDFIANNHHVLVQQTDDNMTTTPQGKANI